MTLCDLSYLSYRGCVMQVPPPRGRRAVRDKRQGHACSVPLTDVPFDAPFRLMYSDVKHTPHVLHIEVRVTFVVLRVSLTIAHTA